MSLTVEALAKELNRVDPRIRIGGAMILAEQLFPFIERHIAAGQQGVGDYPHEQMDAIAAERYKVLPTNAGFWPFCVTAGDGERQLYKGHRSSCEAVARQLTGAFLDGGFAATAMLATPQPPKPAGPVPLPTPFAFHDSENQGFLRFHPEADPHLLDQYETVTYLYSRGDTIAYGDARAAAGRAVAVPEDFTTHRKAWRDGLNMAVQHAANADDAIYWMHEVRAFDRAYEELLPAAPTPQQPAAEGANKPAFRERVSEIEDAVASGKMNAHQCFTQMRQLIIEPAAVKQSLTTQAEGAGREAAVCNCHLSPEAWRDCPHDEWEELLARILQETANALGCEPDNEEILAAIDRLKSAAAPAPEAERAQGGDDDAA